MVRVRRDLDKLSEWSIDEVQAAYDDVQNKEPWSPDDRPLADHLLAELNFRKGLTKTPPAARRDPSVPSLSPSGVTAALAVRVTPDSPLPSPRLTEDELHTWPKDKLVALNWRLADLAQRTPDEEALLEAVRGELRQRNVLPV